MQFGIINHQTDDKVVHTNLYKTVDGNYDFTELTCRIKTRLMLFLGK